MPSRSTDSSDDPGTPEAPARRLRADAQRNTAAVLEAAKSVFVESGVDAPVREIAARAGVGVGTLYRHYPQRSDLIVAVFQTEVDACAAAASVLKDEYPPAEALAKWLHRYVDFFATKRGLADALHSGDPAYAALPAYFEDRLQPALGALLESATAAGEIRGGVDPYDLLLAVGNLCRPADAESSGHANRMVDLIVDGLRYRTDSPTA